VYLLDIGTKALNDLPFSGKSEPPLYLFHGIAASGALAVPAVSVAALLQNP
jgi:hypothetical protein